MSLRVGDLAPPFRGRDQHGQEVVSSTLLETGPVVLYFYPRDFTPLCTAQACEFRDAFEDLTRDSAHIVGVSTDDEATHAKFAAKHGVPYTLLADPDRRVVQAYGMDVFGLGIRTRRTTFVIGKDRRIRGVFNHELSAKAHVTDVRACLASLDAPA